MNKNIIWIILILCVVACSNNEHNSQASIGDGNINSINLNIGYSRLRISLPVFVAQEKGFFNNHGINANLIMYDTAQPLMQALVEGQIDLAGYTALPITYNGMLRSKKKLYFITTMVEDQKHRISYLLKRDNKKSSDVNISNISDLKGKKIGILPTIAYKAWIEIILAKNGIDTKDVIIQQIEPTLQVQALASGGIDALFTNDPAATSAITNGVAHYITDYVEVPRYLGEPFLFGSFNVSKSWADEHSAAFHKLVSALDEAVIYVNNNPLESKECMKKYLPDAFKNHVDRYPDARYLTTTESNEKDYVNIAQQYRDSGITNDLVDVTGLIYNTIN